MNLRMEKKNSQAQKQDVDPGLNLGEQLITSSSHDERRGRGERPEIRWRARAKACWAEQRGLGRDSSYIVHTYILTNG